MAGFNKVILMGNLTRDPEIRYAPSGTPVANFELAVNRRYRQGDETKEEVCFVDIVVFGRQAETCGQYLSKGNGALVEGRLQMRKFETKDRSEEHTSELQSLAYLVCRLLLEKKKKEEPLDEVGRRVELEDV